MVAGLLLINSVNCSLGTFTTEQVVLALEETFVAGAQGVVKRAFDIVRLNLVVPQDPDVETACGALSATAAS